MLNWTKAFVFILIFFSLIACKTGKHKVRKSKKRSYTTYQDADFLFNTESKLSLKEQYKLYKKKKKELELYQPPNEIQDSQSTKKKKPPLPQTHY
jgi:hypothetical protein